MNDSSAPAGPAVWGGAVRHRLHLLLLHGGAAARAAAEADLRLGRGVEEEQEGQQPGLHGGAAAAGNRSDQSGAVGHCCDVRTR